MFGPVTPAVEAGDTEKATRLLIEGVFQMPPGGFDSQPQELRAMQLDLLKDRHCVQPHGPARCLGACLRWRTIA